LFLFGGRGIACEMAFLEADDWFMHVFLGSALQTQDQLVIGRTAKLFRQCNAVDQN